MHLYFNLERKIKNSGWTSTTFYHILDSKMGKLQLHVYICNTNIDMFPNISIFVSLLLLKESQQHCPLKKNNSQDGSHSLK